MNKNKFGLLGEKLGHSKSPEIHEIIFEHLGIDGSYDLLETKKENLSDYIDMYKGLNVTIPYKEDVIEVIEELSYEASEIGAVNTVYKNKGYNTDYFGFEKMLEIKNVDVNGKIVYILGTGGASKAIYTYLVNQEAEKIIYVTRDKEAKRLNSDGKVYIDYEDILNKKGDILINTTPVGMYPNVDESPVSEDVINRFDVILDIIYNPLETKLLKLAKKNNKVYANGLYMLIGQAVKAAEIWNDVKIENSLINQIYRKLSR